MSNLKDTDFDDLFQRASDKYPLRTDSADWGRMAAALEKDPSPDTPDDADHTDRRRRRRFFWWFLLLPLAGIGYYVVHPSGQGGHGTTNETQATHAASPANGGAGDAATTADAVAKNKAINSQPALSGGQAGAGMPHKGATGPQNQASQPNQGTRVRRSSDEGQSLSVRGNALKSPNAAPANGAPRMVNSTNPKTSGKGIRSAGEDVPVRPESTETASGRVPVRPESTETATSINDRFADKEAKLDPRVNPIAASFSLRNTPINQPLARTADPYALNVIVNAPAVKAVKKDSSKPKTKATSHYLYAGILAAPDLSTVKFQSTNGVGTTFGILIGYAFNSHWAIETGAYVERKRYYTGGEYFSTKKVYVSNNVELLSVDGSCYMWEIPLNVRYNFNPQGKTRWFATAGLSTYLMNREKYNYDAKYYNGSWTWTGHWDLKKPSQYPFSIVGVSAGFEQRLGKLGNLRVEPYVRLPLGGIGTGSLPIMSTGINIGLTRKLWK